jgi:hypothetical protein
MMATMAAARMLDQAIRREGLTNEVLGQFLDVQPHMVSMMRRGSAVIPVHRYADLADRVGLPRPLFAQSCLASFPGNRCWQAFAAGAAFAREACAANGNAATGEPKSVGSPG